MDKSAPRGLMMLDIVGAAMVALETLAVAAVGAGYLVYAFTGRDIDVAQMVVLAALFLGLAVALGATTSALVRHHRWARSAALTWQLMQMALGAFYLEVEPRASVVLWLTALVAGVCVARAAQLHARADSDEGGPSR
ncbi:MAG: hypothetical protein WDZ57_00390 [Demequina sp.]